MANLQYTGARYVPILYTNPDDNSNNWKSGESYEPLTIVTYLDDSYTSKIPVPASIGNPADNSDYWVKTGNFNAALSAVQQQANSNTTKINSLNNSNLHNNIICIGDSYLWRTQETDSWGSWLRTYMGDNCTVTLNGLGSAGFIGTAAKTFQQLLADVTVNNDDDISDIVVLGGMNDINQTDSALETAIRNFVTYAKNRFSNAQIHIGFCGWQITGFANRDANIPLLYSTIHSYQYMSVRNGANYINNIEYIMPCLMNVFYESDKIHPKTEANKEIGEAVKNYLFTGNTYNRGNQAAQFNFTVDGTNFTAQNNNIIWTANNNILCIHRGLMNLTVGNTLNVRDYIDMGMIKDIPFRGSTAYPISISGIAYIMPAINSPGVAVEGALFTMLIKNSVAHLRLVLPQNPNLTTITVNTIQLNFDSKTFDILTTC